MIIAGSQELTFLREVKVRCEKTSWYRNDSFFALFGIIVESIVVHGRFMLRNVAKVKRRVLGLFIRYWCWAVENCDYFSRTIRTIRTVSTSVFNENATVCSSMIISIADMAFLLMNAVCRGMV